MERISSIEQMIIHNLFTAKHIGENEIMRKAIVSLVTILLLVTSTFPIHALELNSSNSNANSVSPRRVNGYAYIYKTLEERISDWSPYRTCFGQPAGGTIFHSTSSGIYWVDSSMSAGSWSASIGFSTGIVSVGISLQPGLSGVTGDLFTTTIVGVPVVCQVRKKYRVRKIAIYRYDQYAGPETAVYDSTTYSATTYQIDYRFIRV